MSFGYQPSDALSLVRVQEVREKKHLLTAGLIENSLKSHKSPFFLGLSQPIDDYIRLILHVCKGCSDLPLEEIPEQRPVEGRIVRTRLLVALLRLADQLYINRSRVNLDFLERARNEAALPMNEFAKWWAYNYAQTLPIQNGQVIFHYDIPETQQEYLEHIRALIEPSFDYDNDPNIQCLWDSYGLHLIEKSD